MFSITSFCSAVLFFISVARSTTTGRDIVTGTIVVVVVLVVIKVGWAVVRIGCNVVNLG